MNSPNDNQETRKLTEEETIQRLLRAAGRRPELPEHTRQTWEATLRQALQGTADNKRRYRAIAGALSTILLLLAGYWFVSLPEAGKETPFARVVNIVGAAYVGSENDKQLLQIDTPIDSGKLLETNENAYLAVALKDANIRLNSQTRLRVYRSYIELLDGQVYVDNHSVSEAIVVDTPLAEIRDIGTQFTVAYNATGVVGAVREGSIQVKVGANKYNASAKPDAAQRVSVSNKKDIKKTRVSKRGAEWDWTLYVTPPFAIEGRSAYEFLSWAARELGVQLTFDTSRTQRYAQKTILHGDISNLQPDNAVEVILITTELTLDQSQSGIWLIRKR